MEPVHLAGAGRKRMDWQNDGGATACFTFIDFHSAALARALAALAAAVVQTTAFRRRALQSAVQSAEERFKRGFNPPLANPPSFRRWVVE